MRSIAQFSFYILLILAGCPGFFGQETVNNHPFQVHSNIKESNIMSQKTGSFNKIIIDALFQNIEVICTDDGNYGYEIITAHPGGIHHEIKDFTLNISEELISVDRILRFFEMTGNSRISIRIVIPRDARLEVVNIKNISGRTSLTGMTSTTLNLISTSGEISVSGSQAEYFSTHQTSGRLQIVDSQVSNGEMTHTSGDLDIRNSRVQGITIASTSGRVVVNGGLYGNTAIHTTSGKIDLTLAASRQEYAIQVAVSSGRITIDDQLQAQKRYSLDGNGKNRLNVKATSGDVSIAFGR